MIRKRRPFAKWAALRRYNNAGHVFRHAVDALMDAPGEGGAFDRMAALNEMAEGRLTMAANAWAFPDADRLDPDGYTVAEVHELAARLIGLIADTEAAQALTGPSMLVTLDPPEVTPLPVSPTTRTLLGLLRGERRPQVRAVMVLALADAIREHAGTQAAEVLITVAACYFELSGMSRVEITSYLQPAQSIQDSERDQRKRGEQ